MYPWNIKWLPPLLLMKNDQPNIEWFSIKIDPKASYVVIIPAGDEQEALYEAYKRMIPVNRLFEVEKDVVRVTKLKVNET